jgi:dihydrofolate reductase
MTVSIIAAIAANRVIGNRGALPWRLRDDMKRFARITAGHPVVMGRTTFESLRGPLKGRRNIVLSRSDALSIVGCEVVHSREEAIAAAAMPREQPTPDELFIIGGAEVYRLFLPVARRLYITWIDAEVTGDAFFPGVHWAEWRIIRELPASPDPSSALPHRFVDYERIGP